MHGAYIHSPLLLCARQDLYLQALAHVYTTFKRTGIPVGQLMGQHLAHNHTLEARYVTLFGSNLEVAINDGDRKQNTCTRAESADQIGANTY